MNIGVIGWWHQDNQGDFAILASLRQALAPPHQLVPIDTAFDITPGELYRLNRLDFLILGGGGLFQQAPPRPFDTFEVWGEQLQTPIGIVGLGVDTVQPQYHAAVRALVEQSQFFYVRDRASQQALDHPKVLVSPDLTFAYPLTLPARSRPPAQQLPICGINLRKSPGLDTKQWVEVLQALPVQLRGIPFSSFGSWEELQILQSLDKQCAPAFTPTLYDGLDLMIATAFHSVVFAIQAGIPLIAINYAPKVHRLMTEIGLEEYILEPHAWEQAPALVARVLANHDQLVVQLQDLTRTLTNSARQTLEIVRTQIETCVVAPQERSGPTVTIIVLGSDSKQANQTTLDSCLEQTYENLEIIFVGARTAAIPPEISCIASGSASTLGEKLNLAAALATGDYLSWIKAGDFYTADAIDYLLQQVAELDCEMVYADYYTVDERQRLCNAHVVHPSYKLFRGDVIGPCFLYRRSMNALVGSFKTESPLAAYDYWLRAQQVAALRPLHTRLFYTTTAHRSEQTPQAERLTRRHWRAGQSWPRRIIGQLLDTTLVNARVIRPTMGLLRKVRRVLRWSPLRRSN